VFLRLPGHGRQSQGKGKALVYAASWWNASQVEEYLRDTQMPIWASLSAARTELYRDVQAVYYGSSHFLARYKHTG
jgi:chorismate lyase